VSSTSLPIGSAVPAVAVSVGTHVHSRPFASVTVRFATIASRWSCRNLRRAA
jgi:hypothetical protein